MASENDLPDNEDVKKKALMRLMVAGLITAAALAALWWLDQGKKGPTEKRIQTQQPAPIRSAPPPEPLPPQTEPAATAMPEAAPGELPSPQEPPPPPHVTNMPRPLPPRQESPSSRARQATAEAHPAPAAPESAEASTGAFQVQLGVFTNPENALELVQRLQKKGIRARTETRVYVGPFLNHQEAEKAQSELRRLGMNAVLTTAESTK